MEWKEFLSFCIKVILGFWKKYVYSNKMVYCFKKIILWLLYRGCKFIILLLNVFLQYKCFEIFYFVLINSFHNIFLKRTKHFFVHIMYCVKQFRTVCKIWLRSKHIGSGNTKIDKWSSTLTDNWSSMIVITYYVWLLIWYHLPCSISAIQSISRSLFWLLMQEISYYILIVYFLL